MSKRNHILSTAMRLFNQHGYHVVGVDLIRDEAQVSKMTLYKYFPTKAMLIEEVLTYRHQLFKSSLEQSVEGFVDPVDCFYEVFNWHVRWFMSKQFYGCMFIKAVNEFHEEQAYMAICSAHKQWVYEYIRSILEKMAVDKAEQQARYVQVVLDGMIVNTSIFQSLQHVDTAWEQLCVGLGIVGRELKFPDKDSIVESVFEQS